MDGIGPGSDHRRRGGDRLVEELEERRVGLRGAVFVERARPAPPVPRQAATARAIASRSANATTSIPTRGHGAGEVVVGHDEIGTRQHEEPLFGRGRRVVGEETAPSVTVATPSIHQIRSAARVEGPRTASR